MYRGCNLSSDLNCTYRREIAANCSPQVLALLNEIFFHYCIIIVVVGILGNGCGLGLLLKAKYKMRHYSMNSFLTAVYFCDFAFLLSLALQLAKVAKFNVHIIPASCQFTVYTTNVFNFVSQWSMWALSLERYLAICRPILMFHINTRRNTIKLLVLFVFVALTLEMWVFFVVKTETNGRCSSRVSLTAFNLLNLCETGISSILPGMMIAAFTFGTFRSLRRHESLFTELDPSLIRADCRQQTSTNVNGTAMKGCETFAVISRKASQKLHKRERQTAWFLITIVVVDTVLNKQNFGIRLFSMLYNSPLKFCLGLRTLHIVSSMLYYLQYALNVFYLVVCRRGRYFVRRKHSRGVSSSEVMRKRSFDVPQSMKACNSL